MTSLEEWVGLAIDIARRDWLGLPWKTDPNGSTAVDWKPVLPGTYYFAKADGRWIYICQGNDEFKVRQEDFEAYWPNV